MKYAKRTDNKVIPSEVPAKRVYTKPALVELGKVTSLTMGSQPGPGESGAPGLFRAQVG
jgi:hypothetical protein